MVTGATRGIGRATATGLARLGATVVVVARDAARSVQVAGEIRAATGNEAVSHVVADLASLASVRDAAAEIARRHPAVHVLVNNAGINAARRTLTPDGLEATLAVNHLAPFLLARLLEPQLRLGAPSRVITVTSWFERLGRLDLGDLQSTRGYNGLRAYYASKLANVLFTRALARRLAGTGVTANCVDPGLVATDLLRERWWWRPRWLQPVWRTFLLSPEQAAARVVHAASSPALSTVSGHCLGASGREVRTSRRSRDDALAERLWELSDRLVSGVLTRS